MTKRTDAVLIQRVITFAKRRASFRMVDFIRDVFEEDPIVMSEDILYSRRRTALRVIAKARRELEARHGKGWLVYSKRTHRWRTAP